MKNSDYAARTAEFINSFIGKAGYVLLKTEFVTEDGLKYLRAYIDLTEEERSRRAEEIVRKQAGKAAEEPDKALGEPSEGEEPEEEIPAPEVSINDCAAVSRRVSKWLDQEDFIDEEYTLEVCSKGYLKEEGENS